MLFCYSEVGADITITIRRIIISIDDEQPSIRAIIRVAADNDDTVCNEFPISIKRRGGRRYHDHEATHHH